MTIIDYGYMAWGLGFMLIGVGWSVAMCKHIDELDKPTPNK